jgi:hypothetical protein
MTNTRLIVSPNSEAILMNFGTDRKVYQDIIDP